jgi:hypothetical protein
LAKFSSVVRANWVCFAFACRNILCTSIKENSALKAAFAASFVPDCYFSIKLIFAYQKYFISLQINVLYIIVSSFILCHICT